MLQSSERYLSSASTGGGLAILEYELAAEIASELGRHGKRVEITLAALRDAEQRRESSVEMERAVDVAAAAVWRYFIHREACGLRVNDDTIEDYRIPGKVLARLGAGRP